MRTPEQHLLNLAILFVALLLLTPVNAQENDKEEADAAPTSALSNANMGGDTLELFPVGTPWEMVRVPRYNARQELVSMLHSKTLTRESPQQLRLDGMTVVMFQSGTMNLRLETDRAIYDLKSEKMRSRSRTKIQHKQFDMTGDRMEFDTTEQSGTLNGNVEMIIFNMGDTSLPLPGASITPTEEETAEEPEAPTEES